MSVVGTTQAASTNATDLPGLRALSHHARVTALVVRLRDMQTIASINPDERLTPASVSKLFSASAALQQFGPTYRFVSRFTSKGRIHGHTLNGNLVFVGGGDPSLDNANLHKLIERLRAAGVNRVRGNLVIDDGLWGIVPCVAQDRCNARKRASHAYSAPLSAAGVNFGTIAASVYPGAEAGAATRVVLHPEDLTGYAIDNHVKTVDARAQTHVKARRTYTNGRSTLHLRGKIAAGSAPYIVRLAVTGATAETGRILSALLADAGIHIDGYVTARSINVGNKGRTLAAIKSTTLAEQLVPMMAYSNNYMADTLTLDIAADRHGNLPLTLPRAAQALEALSRHADQAAFPKQKHITGAIFNSGSGLTVGNKVSARNVVALLTYMYHQDALFPAFYGSLPVPLSAPFFLLKQGNLAFQTRLVAKTGLLDDPVSVNSVAGYFRLADGGFAAYAIIINGTRTHPHLPYRQTIAVYEKDMEAILKRY